MEGTSTPTRVSGKLDSLPKEELLKFIKKQALASKELKKKVEDLNTSLTSEKEEVIRLEKEKKEWISRGVSAEFEKKDKIVKKDKELELAAQLGKEMLAENDDLQVEIEEMKRDHDETIQTFEDELDKVLQEKETLEATLEAIQEEYKSAKKEAEECRIALNTATEIQEKDSSVLLKENQVFREKVKELEHQLNTSTVNLKYHKLKEKYDELIKENRFNKEAKVSAEEESKSKSERMVILDKDMKILRKDIAEHQRQKKADLLEIDSLREANAELTSSLYASNDKIKELDEELQKIKADKDKQTKTLRNMKTKLERATQMEEELKKQLNIIVSERDEISKKLQKKNQQKTRGKGKSPREDELEKEVLAKVDLVKELENQLSVLESENSEFQKSNDIFRENNTEIHERYENVKKDFESLSFEIDELTVWKNNQIEEKEKMNLENENLIEKCKKLEEDLHSLQIEKENIVSQHSVLDADLKSMKEKLKKSTDHTAQEKEKLQVKIRQHEDEKKKLSKLKNKRAAAHQKSSPSKTLKTVDKSTQNTDESEETKATILKLEARVDELLNQLQLLNEEKHNQEIELEELFTSHDDLQNKYDFECQERERMENEVHCLEEKVAKLESDTKDGKETGSDDLNLQITHLEETVGELRKQSNHYKQEVEVKEQYIVQLRKEIEELQQKQNEVNAANNKEVDNIYHEFEHLDKELSASKKELEVLHQEKENSTAVLLNMESEKKKLVETLSITSQKLLEVKKSFDLQTQEIVLLKKTIENLNDKEETQVDSSDSQKELLRSEVKELTEKLQLYNELVSKNKAQCDEIKSLQMDLQYYDSEYKKVSTDNTHLKESFERIISLKTELQTKLSELNVKFRANEEENSLNKTILKKVMEKVQCNDILDLENCIDTLQQKGDVFTTKEYESLKQELEAIQSEKNTLIATLKEAEEGIHKQNELIKEKEVVFEQVHNDFLSLRSEFDVLNKQKVEFEQNVVSTQELLTQKNIVIEELKTNIANLEEDMEKSSVVNNKLQTLHEEIKYKDILISDLTAEVNELGNEKVKVKESKNLSTSCLSSYTQTEQEILNLDSNFTQTDAVISSDNADDKLTEEKTEKMSHLQKEVKNLKQIIKDIQVDSVNMKTSEENYLNELREKQAIIDRMNMEVESLQLSITENVQKVNESDMHTEQIQMELAKRSAKYDDLVKTLSFAQDAVKELEDSLTEKDEVIKKNAREFVESDNKMKEELLEMSENLSLMETENKGLTDELNRREAQCSHFEALVEEKQQLVQSLKESLNQQNDGNDGKVIAEFEQYKISYQKLEDELQSALNRIEELEQKLKERYETTEQLELLVKEKGEKGNKFRNVAIKAKKELEGLRTQYEVEKRTLEEQVKLLLEEGKTMKNELVQQKTECGKHEEEFEEMQNEIKSLQQQISVEKEKTLKVDQEKDVLNIKLEQMAVSFSANENKIENLTLEIAENDVEKGKLESAMTEMEEKLKKSEEMLKLKNEELDKLKTEYETLQKNLGHAEKETQQMNVMNLEIKDYLRTIDNLQAKSQEKEKLLNESQEIISNLKEQQNNLTTELDLLKKVRNDQEERNRKLKQFIVKLKKEVADGKMENASKGKEQAELLCTTEALKHNIDELKLEVSNLLKEKNVLTEQLKSAHESHEKMRQTLEVKFARVNSDLSSSQRVYKELQEEYENYKVRAHNVLKQQKSLKVDSEKEIDNIERARLEDMAEQLKLKLQETAQRLNVLQSDHGELELEYERLQTRHKQFVEEITEKETGWKQRFEQFKIDKTTKILEYEDKIKLLTKENEALLRSAKENSEMMKADEENYTKEISSLKEELKKLQEQTRSHTPPRRLDLQKQDSVESKSESHMSLSFKSVLERQEGEGMDQKELELIDTLSQRSPSSVPHTPLSPSASSVLEKILSPSEQYLASPQTPGTMREELFTLRSSLSTSLKKNEHLTALLRDCEANASRLDEQAKVLKDEIRRLERNEQREQALSNLEYLKNVIIKFLKVGVVERQQLIPVICTMLKLSSEEKIFITEFAKGDEADTSDDSSWSSYVYRWTSLS
ncbi:GRIP and coiled-coil domain-containing protein 2-like isoform X2 [Hydractinia symbiolongicarpus]|uniref:GRIP and coiled-coil domain-containing protein 2-like isoform X2 n=1 Tax=Hydractinia symbiolongicarpus TaxID=13093 RepID=UPI00254DE39A|nr:GRIP and coiled-coil domain-containing protein 2-like isoform X2 [Hydractinia symbiolongicarpus]